MKVITCPEPNQLTMQEIPDPVPGADDVLVRMRRIGICGTDLHAYGGNQPFFSYPRVLGHELAGEVAAIGDNVTNVAVGDNVVLAPYLECGDCPACRLGKTNCCTNIAVIGVHKDGGMCEQIVHPADHVVKSDTLTLDQLAMVEFHAIGAHAVRRIHMRESETVCVVGCGPIGMAVMQFAKIAGARVLAMDIQQQRLEFCKEQLGIDGIVNAANDPKAQLAELTNGDMPTAVFEATGNPKSMEASFQYIAHSGRLVFVSIVLADIAFNDPEFHKRETTLLSSRNATLKDFEYVMECMEQGKLKTDPMATHRVAFDDMIGVFPDWLKPETGVIKALVDL